MQSLTDASHRLALLCRRILTNVHVLYQFEGIKSYCRVRWTLLVVYSSAPRVTAHGAVRSQLTAHVPSASTLGSMCRIGCSGSFAARIFW